VNAPRVQRTRPATSAVNQVTSLATVPTLLKRVLDVAVEDSHPGVVVDLKSATRPVYFIQLQEAH
jgi:anti-anti-sigma regulatory factor